MNNLIQWPKAKYWTRQWNPMIGCKPCSPACENCYAAAWARRFGQSFEPHETNQKPPRSGVVFCGNMTDLFGIWTRIQRNFIADTLYKGVSTATYLWLTKHPSRMRQRIEEVCLCHKWRERMSSHHYFGFTAENQEWYDARIRDFRAANLLNGWLSAEPLLGPIDLGLRYIAPEDQPFDWVVVGCESGPKRRPCKLEWIESIVEQCRYASVPVFVKQIDIGGKCVTDIAKFPKHLQIRQVPWAKKGGEA